ncbi:hypothetical protein LEN26_004015 [Aphanomyces euteiches]|nr:hypothetical protein AeMF1_007550 [Aphanomyces euteiches]KAH9150782.1 hypothetical protein LEN26_004015 [Aphanomyces euteiches]KAH9181029.1 hypothetical protein AeNC1_016996 [Aphanomyces euteiches]
MATASNERDQFDDDDEIWTVLYSQDLNTVSSSGVGSPATSEPDDPDMWASICNLLHDKPEDLSTEKDTSNKAKPKDKRKAKRVRVYTNKAEVQQLEAEIRELQDELIQAKRGLESTTDGSFWETAAKQQRVEKNKALQENKQLQDAVHERNEYIDRLQKTILKTPRWMAIALPGVAPDEGSRCIPADPALRIAAIHRIADNQYRQMQTKFIQARAIGLSDDTCRGEPVSLAHQELGFLAVNHINIPAPFHGVARAVWSVLNGNHGPILSENEQEVASLPPEDGVHVLVLDSSKRHNVSFKLGAKDLRRGQSNRTCICYALEDATVDRQPTDAIDDMNTWWQFAPHADDPSSSTMTVLGQSNISRLVHYKDLDAEPDEVVLVLKRILTSLDRPAEAPAPSFLKSFIDRRRRMRQPIQYAIETVIRAFNDCTIHSSSTD